MADGVLPNRREIDWSTYVLRLAGPEPPKRPAYYFSNGVVKYERRDHNPFDESEDD